MRRYSLVDGVMVEDPAGPYVLFSDVMTIDKVTKDTLILQLDGIREQINEWPTE